jgi:hypothetical protein
MTKRHWVLLLPLCGAVAPLPAAAQAGGAPVAATTAHVVVGEVLDAATGAPVPAAAVVVQPETTGAFPGGPASGHGFATSSRAVLTGADGVYRFGPLPSGVYRIYVSRIGYRPYSVVVELRSSGVSRVGVALVAEPIPLAPIRPAGQRRGAWESTSPPGGDDAAAARLRAAEQRRRQYLTTDARELTHADAIEAVTLGDADVLRALQRLPGVSTRSDYTAELWTRGAPWSHTRVYFDGIPLFNPLHALGVVSGVGSNALGAVWFHPGTRSAAMAEGAAGVVDLQSRRAAGGGEMNVLGDVSLMSAGLALDQRIHDGRAGWMLSGRQTYTDWLTGLARRASDRDDVSFPYGFSEVAGRVDARLSAAAELESSWLWERDHLTSLRPWDTDRLRAEWGNTAGRVSLTTRAGPVHLRHTAAFSRHDAGVASDVYRTGEVPAIERAERASDTGVEYDAITGTLWPEPASVAGPAWSAGYSFERQRARYRGPQVLPVPRVGAAGDHSDTVRVGWTTALSMAAFWGERTWSAGPRTGIRAGLRAEAGTAPSNATRIRLAPRLSARFAPIPEVALSAGATRVWQYAQAIAPGGVHVASLATTDVWLLAGGDVPAVRSDIVTAGAEVWVAPGRLVTLNAFGRRAAGMAVSDPRPGHVYERPAWVEGENRAHGVEAGVRQITGRVTGSASYTWSRSTTDAADLRFPAGSDRRHVVNATAMLHATRGLRAGFALTAASGVPFTRTVDTARECADVTGCDPERLPWLGEPHAERAPTYASLDLLLDASTRLAGLDIGVYLQLRNALGRENAVIYTGDEPGCMPGGCGGDLRSVYERGMPRLPVVGLRVRR